MPENESFADLMRANKEQAKQIETLEKAIETMHETCYQVIFDVMRERDRAIEYADKLSKAIAPVEEIGERTKENNPWENALEIMENTVFKVKELEDDLKMTNSVIHLKELARRQCVDDKVNDLEETIIFLKRHLSWNNTLKDNIVLRTACVDARDYLANQRPMEAERIINEALKKVSGI